MIAVERIEYLQNRIARQGDQSAYKELFISFHPYLFQFAFTFVKSKELADEIVSDVFIKIWQNKGSVDRIENLKLYMYVATRNTALNYLDKQKRANFMDIESISTGLRSSYSDPEQLMITSDMLALIDHAILELPPKCRIIFKLVKEDRMKYKEVAELLHVSVKTVENQLAIAVRKIGSAIRFDSNRTVSSPVRNSR